MSNMQVSAQVRLLDKYSKPSQKMERSSERLGRRLKRTEREAIAGSTSFDRMAEKLENVTRGTRRFTLEQRKLGKEIERINKLQAKSIKVGAAGAGAGVVGYGVLRTLSDPTNRMRAVERSRGELQSLDMSKGEIDAVVREGRAMSRAFAGIDTAAFTSAAYDIKSGISSLSGDGVAKMTALAAMTAKATKGDTAGMTSLFATAYGTYKETLYSTLSDTDFGNRLSAALAGSVKVFKTDGAKMQQAIESMGSGLAASGISMAEQFTALGMLQQKMQAGEAGTAVRAMETNAANAQKQFEKMGLAIETIDANGNMRSIPDILEQAQAALGDNYTTEIGDMIKQAFGTDEAAKIFKALWGQSKAMRDNMGELNKAMDKGADYTRNMARAMDSNMDARLQKMTQRWEDIKLSLGYRMIPLLERTMPIFEGIARRVANFIDEHPRLTSVLVGLTVGIAGIATIMAPVITSVAGLTYVIAQLGKRSRQAALEASLAGGRGRRGGGAGWLGKLKGKGGWLGAGVAALSIGSTLMGDGTAAEKAAGVTQDVGGLGGALAGGAAGAALGSVVPFIGTAVGGLLGSIIGYMGGDMLGGKIGSAFLPDQQPFAGAKPVTAPSVTDNSTTTWQIYQQPGEDAEAFARRVNDIHERKRAEAHRSRLYD